MICQLCGQAPATRKDAHGRDVCGKLAHKATVPARKNATKLQRYVRQSEGKKGTDLETLGAAKGLLRALEVEK